MPAGTDSSAAIARHLHDQDGAISRRPVLSAGGKDALVERRLRRCEWARVHPGVYLTHTGPPSWDERAWAAVLLRAPAAPGVASNASRARPPGRSRADGAAVEVVIDHRRRVDPAVGVRTTRTKDFAALASSTSPRHECGSSTRC